jgi:hypothetical protein
MHTSFRMDLEALFSYIKMRRVNNKKLWDDELERGREKNSRRVGESEKVLGRSERHFIVGRGKEHWLWEGSHASLASPSDKSRVKVKAFGWLEAVA